MEDQKGQTHVEETEEKKMNDNDENLVKVLDDFDEPLNLTVDGKDNEGEFSNKNILSVRDSGTSK